MLALIINPAQSYLRLGSASSTEAHPSILNVQVEFLFSNEGSLRADNMLSCHLWVHPQKQQTVENAAELVIHSC